MSCYLNDLSILKVLDCDAALCRYAFFSPSDELRQEVRQ